MVQQHQTQKSMAIGIFAGANWAKKKRGKNKEEHAICSGVAF